VLFAVPYVLRCNAGYWWWEVHIGVESVKNASRSRHVAGMVNVRKESLSIRNIVAK
jgi:hypothetical protein